MLAHHRRSRTLRGRGVSQPAVSSLGGFRTPVESSESLETRIAGNQLKSGESFGPKISVSWAIQVPVQRRGAFRTMFADKRGCETDEVREKPLTQPLPADGRSRTSALCGSFQHRHHPEVTLQPALM